MSNKITTPEELDRLLYSYLTSDLTTSFEDYVAMCKANDLPKDEKWSAKLELFLNDYDVIKRG